MFIFIEPCNGPYGVYTGYEEFSIIFVVPFEKEKKVISKPQFYFMIFGATLQYLVLLQYISIFVTFFFFKAVSKRTQVLINK